MFISFLKNAVFMASAEIVYPEISDVSAISADVVPPAWPSAVVIALCAALGIICVVLSVIILLQKKRASGIGAAIAGSGETYWSKNKGKSVEGTLEKYTKWGGAAFIIVALLINMLM